MAQGTLEVPLYVVNRGDKVVSNAVLRVLIPPGVGLTNPPNVARWRSLPQWNSGEMLYSVFERDISQPMPPKCIVQVTLMNLNIGTSISKDFLYQIMHEDGVTPEDGSATRLKSSDEVDLNGLIVGLPPR